MRAYLHSGEVWTEAHWERASARLRPAEPSDAATRYGEQSADGRRSEVEALIRSGATVHEAVTAALTDEIERGIITTTEEAYAFIRAFDKKRRLGV